MVLEEQGVSDLPSNELWWLNSGGYFLVKDRIARTNFRDLPEGDKWRALYGKNNPVDTDSGLHPQNIFRLVTRTKWKNFVQEGYFRINKVNLSKSENRNASNGFLFFSHYVDGDNLYYSGIRVDGHLIVKKKLRGTYYTLVEKTLYMGKYDRDTNPNLLPLDHWIGLRTKVETKLGDPDSVHISVWWDEDCAGNWQLLADVVDNGSAAGPPFLEEGFAGIRTDFLDIEFCRYSLRNLETKDKKSR